MSWVIVQRLPQEDNRIVGTWTLGDDISWDDLRNYLFAYFCESVARSSSMESPRSYTWSGGPVDTGCLMRIRVKDDEEATDIEAYDFALFKTYNVDIEALKKDYEYVHGKDDE